MKTVITRTLLAAAIFVGSTNAAVAQDSSWGVIGGFTPTWRVPDNAIRNLFDARAVDLTGSELRIGVVRGRDFGGDWGVSLIHKRFKEGSTVTREADFDLQAGTYPALLGFTTNDTTLLGVELHKYANFGTIKERVQIGMIFGGGIGQLRGTVNRAAIVFDGISTTGDEDDLGQEITRVSDNDIAATELFAPLGFEIEYVPLFRTELAVTGILAPGFKVRASGGFNMPGTQIFSVSAIYFFGQR
jgi:hypothetical protein